MSEDLLHPLGFATLCVSIDDDGLVADRLPLGAFFDSSPESDPLGDIVAGVDELVEALGLALADLLGQLLVMRRLFERSAWATALRW